MESTITNEKQVLCLLFKDSTLLSIFDENYFVTNQGKDLYLTLRELESVGLDFSIDNIIAEGNRKNKEINRDLLTSIIETECNEDAFDYYFEKLKKDYASHNIENNLLKSILKEVARKKELDVGKIRGFVDNVIDNLALVEGRESLLLSGEDIVKKHRRVFEQRDSGLHFYSTGDYHLDKLLTTGFQPGYITTIFASTGVGKSAYSLNLISREINLGTPCMYFSLEMDSIATMDRLIALRQRIPFSELHPKPFYSVPEYIMKAYTEETKKLQNLKDFFFVEESGLSLDDIRALIKKGQQKMGRTYMVVFVDLLTMVKEFCESRGNKADSYEDAMNKLHRIARDLKIHFVVVVQANREADKARIRLPEEIHRLVPHIENIKNSSAIAERSRNILSIFRKKHYMEKLFPDDERLEIMDDIMEVRIGKQSQGEANKTVYYFYTPEYFLCRPMEPKDELTNF